jgi:hypothetical protein
MSLAPVSLRSISGIVSTSSLGGMSHPKCRSTLTSLSSLSSFSSTCCHLSSPACLESLSCLVSPPRLASSTETLSGLSTLSSLSRLSEGWDDEKHAHAMASMYGFHI